ncbi:MULTISPECIES: glycosyltransferase family 4 protein [Rhodanobacter]|uniref:glycosyltransferase family 4 protein n=1 Tax=Rhodanobacter TaxID=75309 RepID=UPI00041A86AA|nr:MULTISPECIES: glycosyltransferase family 4 protein [Rhodanobacter]UJJ54924.1 glycosyltransferase family 4 protein [Rhodanobacter thiooxydans]
MHVAQINFLPVPAGLASADVFEQWPTLADVAEAVASAGTRVSVIQLATRPERVQRNGIDYRFIPVPGGAQRTRRLAELLGEIRPDVLHLHSLGFAADAFALAQRLPSLPIVIQDHADRPPRRWRWPWWRRRYAAAAGIAFTAAELAQPFTRAGLFAPHTRLFAIPESSSRFTPGDRARVRAETGLHGEPCALWVGHLNSGKDPLAVLDGVASAVQRLPGLQLWCVFGNAPLLEAVRQRIAGDPRLAGRVHLLGKVAHARIEALMRATDLFVAGSHAESCGYSLLEALACGVAPLVTDIPAFRALTDDGRIGRLWPCGDAAQLAEALVDVATNGPSPAQVRAHFDATLSFAALGRRWAGAYAQVRADRLWGPG